MSFIFILFEDHQQAANIEQQADEPLWTAKQTAEFLNVDEDAVYELARLGTLPCVPMGERRKRFNPAVIRQWVKNGGKLDKGLRAVG